MNKGMLTLLVTSLVSLTLNLLGGLGVIEPVAGPCVERRAPSVELDAGVP